MKYNILHAFRITPFSYLWFSEIFTQIAVNIFNFFLIFVVYSLTKSNTAVSLAVLSFTLPAVFIGVIAGVYVDRWNKKTVLIVTNLLRALLLILLIPFSANLYALYIFSILFTVVTQFFIPAETPVIPVIVRKKFLYGANALFGLGIFASILVAYVLSGPMLLILGKTNTLLLLALMLGVSSFFVSLIRLPKSYEKKIIQRTKSVKLAVKEEIISSIRIMNETREIRRSLIYLAIAQVLILIVAVLAPGYASNILGIAIEEFPLRFIAPAAFGVLVGAVILIHFLSHVKKEKIITLGILLSGVSMLILPFGSEIATRNIIQFFNQLLPGVFDITALHIVMSIAFLLGFANALVFVPANTILQENTTDELRGKVYGVLNTVVGIFSLLPIILVGSLSDLVGVTAVIVGLGVFLLIFGAAKVIFRV